MWSNFSDPLNRLLTVSESSLLVCKSPLFSFKVHQVTILDQATQRRIYYSMPYK